MSKPATITREHRRSASRLLGYFETEPFVAAGIANGFSKGSNFESVAGAIADAEARGRAAGIAEEHARATELIGAAAPLHWAFHGDQASAHAWEKRAAQYVEGVPLTSGEQPKERP